MTTVSEKNYTQAASMLRIQGIISIVFGALGSLLGFILMIVFAINLGQSYSNTVMIENLIYFVASILFVLIPHLYLTVAGIVLVREPEPKLARILMIINVIVGAITNYIVLAFAIISLTQIKDYEEGYKSR
jgi:uncharacterized membrane protein